MRRVLTGSVRWLGALIVPGITGWGALALPRRIRAGLPGATGC